jgi:hypothetical protein
LIPWEQSPGLIIAITTVAAAIIIIIIILSEVSQAQKAKGHMFFCHMWNIDIIQMQQYSEKQVTVRGGHLRAREHRRRKLRR